jgi:hypothetical protein
LRASRSSRSRRRPALLAVSLLIAAYCAATAAAQTSIQPRQGDDYLEPASLSGFEDPEPFPRGPVGVIADTGSYTVQRDLYAPEGGGPEEPLRCAGAEYGNTIWVVFHADRFGSMRIDAAGAFDPVIRLVPFDGPANPVPDLRRDRCANRFAGEDELLTAPVARRQWYAVQVGGTPEPQGGPLQLTFELGPPPEVAGRATLAWQRRPLRVTDLRVEGMRGRESLQLRCTRGACRKRRVRPSGSGPRTVELLRDRRVRRGATIELRVMAPGHVGRYYRWRAGRGRVSMAARGCLNPGSRRPREQCGE